MILTNLTDILNLIKLDKRVLYLRADGAVEIESGGHLYLLA